MHVTSKNLDYHVIGCCCYDRMDQSGSLFFAQKKRKKKKKQKSDENLQQVDMN